MLDTHSVMTPEELAEYGVSMPGGKGWHEAACRVPAMSPFGEFEITCRARNAHTAERLAAWLSRCNDAYGWGGHVEAGDE